MNVVYEGCASVLRGSIVERERNYMFKRHERAQQQNLRNDIAIITYIVQNINHCKPIWNTPIKLSRHCPVDYSIIESL
jgi:flagellar basal body P-ring protein FlgI